MFSKSRGGKRAPSDREPVSSWWRLDCRKNVQPQWNGRDRSLSASFLLVQGSGPDKGPCAAAQTDRLSAAWRNVSDHHGYRSERSPRCGYWDCSVRSHTSSVCRLTTACIIDANLGVNVGGAGGQGWLRIMFTPTVEEVPQNIDLGSFPCAKGKMRKLWEVLIQPSTLRASTRGSEDRIIHAPFPRLLLCGKFCSSSFLIAYIQHTHTDTHVHAYDTHIVTCSYTQRLSWGLMLQNNSLFIVVPLHQVILFWSQFDLQKERE